MNIHPTSQPTQINPYFSNKFWGIFSLKNNSLQRDTSVDLYESGFDTNCKKHAW